VNKILILGDINSTHTIKWVNGLCDKGFEVGVFTNEIPNNNWYNNEPKISAFFSEKNKINFKNKIVQLFAYLNSIYLLKKTIKSFKPDIIHAFYASSYGLLGAISNFHPYFISSWGSDVYLFPRINIITNAILKYNFRKADKIFATSLALSQEMKLFSKKESIIIPFGVDTDFFKPNDISIKSDKIVIGTVKSLETIYGIDILIRAFAIICQNNPNKNLELVIIGSGSEKNNLVNQINELNLSEKIILKGRIEKDKIVELINSFDIAAFLSRSESFGVALLECASCSLPLIGSNVGGIPEIINNGVNGFLVPIDNLQEIVKKIEILINDEILRKQFGREGRKLVESKYIFEESLKKMIQFYQN